MNKELEEAMSNLKGIDIKFFLNGNYEQSNYIVDRANEVNKYIETILNYIEILETATNNRYPYVTGGRTLYSKLQQLNKEYLIKDYLRLRNETEQLIKEKENSIPIEVIKNKIKEEKITQKDIQKHNYDENRMKAVNERLMVLQEILEEREVK